MKRRWALAVALTACGRVDFANLRDPGGDAGASDISPADAASAIRVVQTSGFASVGNATQATTAFANPPTAGDAIVVYAWSWDLTSTSIDAAGVSDTASTAYTLAIENGATGCDTGVGAVALLYAANIAASAQALSITVVPVGASGQEIATIAVEYAGLDPASPLDQIGSSQTDGGTSPQLFDSGMTSTTRAADELVATAGNTCQGYPNAVAWADTSGFTTLATETETTTHEPGIAADRIVTSEGSFDDVWQITFSPPQTFPSIGVIATFH